MVSVALAALLSAAGCSDEAAPSSRDAPAAGDPGGADGVGGGGGAPGGPAPGQEGEGPGEAAGEGEGEGEAAEGEGEEGEGEEGEGEEGEGEGEEGGEGEGGEGEGEEGEGEGEDPVPDGPVEFPPDGPGPYDVGVREFLWNDDARGRGVWTRIWYPAEPRGDGERVVYLNVLIAQLQGQAYADAAADRQGAPYPAILFSHGFQGLSIQSFTLTERLASHGFVVIAPNHQGNTLFDFNASDEQVAQVAIERPADLVYAWTQALALSDAANGPLTDMIDPGRVAVSGHSFGGFTAVLLAGGVVDVDAARARCDAGVPGDVFCPYIPYWPPGERVGPPAAAPAFRAVLAFAPGGWAAIGAEGLGPDAANPLAPTLLMGGTVDEYTRNDLRPFYDTLPHPVLKVEIERLGHMGFTDICRLPFTPVVPTLSDLCNSEELLDIDRGFALINPYAVAWARRHVLGDRRMDRWLGDDYAATLPEVAIARR